MLSPAAYGQEALERVREKCGEFFTAIEQKSFDTYVKGRISDYDRVYKNYHYLVTAGKIDEVKGFLETTDSDEKRLALDKLVLFLTGQTIRVSSAAEIDGANNYLADTQIVVGGEEIPLRDVTNRMAEEVDRSKRRQWSFAFKEFLENANVYLAQSVHLSNAKAKEFGFAGFQDFLSTYKDFDIEASQALARTFLAATDTLYRDLLLEEIATVYGEELDLRTIRFYDMPRIEKMARFDDGLPQKKAYQEMKKFFGNIGFKLDGGRSTSLSVEEAREPHAKDGIQAYVTAWPRSLKVGYKPTSGFLTYGGMLREIGTLLYRAGGGGAMFENHFLGDPTTAFAVGYLFESLMMNPGWLKDHTKLDDESINAVRRAMAFHRLFEAREYCGRILFLPKVYEGVKQPEEIFETVFEPIRMWRHTEVDRVMYMQANDDFDCTARLKGLIIGAALDETLTRRYGENWYKEKPAAQFLATFWSPGQQDPSSAYAEKVGMTDFDPGLLISQIESSVTQ